MEREEFNKLGTICDEVGVLLLEKHKLSDDGCIKVCELLTTKFADLEAGAEDDDTNSDDGVV